MNQEETLLLLSEGKDAWNQWAREILQRQEILKKNGDWKAPTHGSTNENGINAYSSELTAPARTWIFDAKVIFSPPETLSTLDCPEDFNDLIFPYELAFENCRFRRMTSFKNATFYGPVKFNTCKFLQSLTLSYIESFSSMKFDNCVFHDNFTISNCTIRGNFSFLFSNVQSDLKLKKVELRNKSTILHCKILGSTNIRSTTTNKETKINQSVFNGDFSYENNVSKGDIDISDSRFKSSLSIKNAKFLDFMSLNNLHISGPTEINFSKFEKRLSSSKVIFDAQAFFLATIFKDNVSFTECTVVNTFWLSDCVFQRDLKAKGINFRGLCWLEKSKIDGFLDFTDAKFKGTSWFQGSYFGGFTDFSGSKFDGIASFSNSSFTGNSRFEKVHFCQDALFSNTQFEKKSNFESIKFEGKTSFSNAVFKGGASFRNSLFVENSDFSHTRVRTY